MLYTIGSSSWKLPGLQQTVEALHAALVALKEANGLVDALWGSGVSACGCLASVRWPGLTEDGGQW
jgi:hypothetical protein